MSRSRTYPAPTVPEPDLDRYMAEALYGDGDSEATDGCPIEPDGVCEHGHPSWELFWGII